MGRQAACLNAQGRVEVLFCVSCLQEDEFLLVSDGGNIQEIRASLMRFVVADQVELEHLEHFKLLHIQSDSVPEQLHRPQQDQPYAITSFMDGFLQVRTRSTQAGVDCLLPEIQAASIRSLLTASSIQELDQSQQTLERILANRPIFSEEISSDRVFLEYGLREAVSFSKGCYVGQEVLERADARGKLPKRLCRLILATEIREPDLIYTQEDREHPVGQILSYAYDSQRKQTFCFALISEKFFAGPNATSNFVNSKGIRANLLN